MTITATDRRLLPAAFAGLLVLAVPSLTYSQVPLGPPWMCGDVGAVGVPGECNDVGDGEDPGLIEVRGSGADIWGTADAFSFARLEIDGDRSINTRVNFVENIHPWTKVGIMIRDWNGGHPGARHASLFVTPTTVKGVAFQRRRTTAATSVHTSGPAITTPVWLRLVRSGDAISAFVRPDHWPDIQRSWREPWQFIGREQFSDLPARLSLTFVSSSHDNRRLAAGRLGGLSIRRDPILQSVDIGNTSRGRTTTDGTTVRLDAGGEDIWGTSDAFRFHYAPFNGDVQFMARVLSLTNTHVWAKAGVMIRESLEPNSRHVMLVLSPGKGISMQGRGITGASSVEHARVEGAAPQWLMIRRVGNTITAYRSIPAESPESFGWEGVGEVQVNWTGRAYLGLAFTSHSPGRSGTAVFDDVRVQQF
jgi:hypothetical protein